MEWEENVIELVHPLDKKWPDFCFFFSLKKKKGGQKNPCLGSIWLS
jgi:hypothetical protein